MMQGKSALRFLLLRALEGPDTYRMLVRRPTWAAICCLDHSPCLTAPDPSRTPESRYNHKPLPQLSMMSPGIPCELLHLLLDEAKR